MPVGVQASGCGWRVRRGSGVRVMCGAAAACALAAGGCGITSEQRAQMAESESVLAPFLRSLSPQEAARWAADEYDADKRARGTLMLANAPFGGADAYLAMYRKYVTDDSPGVRGAAALGLAMHGSPSDVPLVLPLMKDPQKNVRLAAVKALQRLHNPEAIPVLLRAVTVEGEAESDVRAEAASALGQYADPKVLQGLIAALDDDNLLVTHNAHQSLKTLTGNDDLPDNRKLWLKWAGDTRTPFAAQRRYTYPVFNRDKVWTDYLPFIGGPVPNEAPATPAGMPSI